MTHRPRLDVFGAPDCSLCGPAKETVRRVAERLDLPYTEHDISGDPVLEARYRAEIPVVEIDGRKAFKYYVDEHDLVARIERAGRGGPRPVRRPD